MNALPARVLVVEDDEMIRELIRLNLELEGFEVFTAIDGQDCLDRAEHIDPHVVTLDVMMPHLDGWTAAEQLRGKRPLADCRIVLVTARTQEEDRRHGERIGVDAYLTKPFDPDELVEIVHGLLPVPPQDRPPRDQGLPQQQDRSPQDRDRDLPRQPQARVHRQEGRG